MNPEELRLYFQTVTDCWHLMKRYSDSNGSDGYWDNLIQEANAIYSRYRTEFCKMILVAVIDELDRVARKKTGGGK